MTITVYGETISTKWKFADKSDTKVAIIGLNIHIKGQKAGSCILIQLPFVIFELF